MRLLRRRDGGPVATYAAVLDGAHLWLEVEDADGPVTLRDVSTTESVEVGDAPLDLTALVGVAYDAYARRARVALAPQERPLTRTPLAPDGVTRWDVTSDEGRLRLVRTSVPATAELDAVDVHGDRVHLRLRPPTAVQPGSHLLLLDQDDTVLASLPVTAHHDDEGGLLEALVSVDDLPPGYFGLLRLAVGTHDDHRRIRRARNDLADAHHAVLLPELYDAGSDEPRARLRWNPDGLLALRALEDR